MKISKLRTYLRNCILLQFCLIELAQAEAADPVKGSIQSFLDSFQGSFGDGVVIVALAGMLIAILRRSFKTALGCLVVVCGVVILRISISVLF